MMDFSKQAQVSKDRTKNPKKLAPTILKAFKDFIFEKAGGKCQCNCGRLIATYHHAQRGSNKDDRTLGGIAEYCHWVIHFSTDSKERFRLTALFRKKGDENYKDFNG